MFESLSAYKNVYRELLISPQQDWLNWHFYIFETFTKKKNNETGLSLLCQEIRSTSSPDWTLVPAHSGQVVRSVSYLSSQFGLWLVCLPTMLQRSRQRTSCKESESLLSLSLLWLKLRLWDLAATVFIYHLEGLSTHTLGWSASTDSQTALEILEGRLEQHPRAACHPAHCEPSRGPGLGVIFTVSHANVWEWYIRQTGCLPSHGMNYIPKGFTTRI